MYRLTMCKEKLQIASILSTKKHLNVIYLNKAKISHKVDTSRTVGEIFQGF